MIRAERRRIERTLRSYKSIPTNERLTASSGIGVLVEIFYKSPLFNEMMKHLPERLSHRSLGAGPLALTLIAGHLLGVESVEDLEEIRDDEFLMELFGDDVPAPRTLLDYLNDFEESHIDGLNQFLNIMSRTLHQMVIAEHPEVLGTDRIVDIDSTYHKHYGDLIEGVTWNYKNEWSLESQVAFNSLGFCHHLWVRPGNTKSGTDADLMINKIYSIEVPQLERKRTGRDYVRMDSAFCNQDTIKACMGRGLLFTITANKATTFWHDLMNEEGIDWKDWTYTDKEVKDFTRQGMEPTKVQLGRIWWKPKWADDTLLFPIIIKRTWKSFCKYREKNKNVDSLFDVAGIAESGGWDYYAVVTNMDLTQWNYQEIMQHHQKRGSTENMNKEAKYGYSLNNLPCRKLVANRAWYIFAMIAHNLMRFVAIMDNPEQPSMAKKTRRKFINFPAKIAERSKQLWLRVPVKYFKGVIELIEGWCFPEQVRTHIHSTA